MKSHYLFHTPAFSPCVRATEQVDTGSSQHMLCAYEASMLQNSHNVHGSNCVLSDGFITPPMGRLCCSTVRVCLDLIVF